jgi:hypothetical protein
MDTRIEFTDGSISTRSFSLRDMVRGLRRTSREALKMRVINSFPLSGEGDDLDIPDLYFGFVMSFDHLETNCLNRYNIRGEGTCDEKFSRVSAAVSDDLTAAR